MLLGSIAYASQPKHILDAGAGSGVLGLMMAQRYDQARITCVELDPKAAEECLLNSERSPFATRMHSIQANLTEFEHYPAFDLIVSNPPYYTSENSSSAANELQKHLSEENFNRWLQACYRLLAPSGIFWMIYPANQLQRIATQAQATLFYECERHTVLNQHLNPVRIISAYQKKAKGLKLNELTIRNSDGTYSEVYKQLTKDFHSKEPIR